MTAPIPTAEAERLRVLYQYEILDTIAERAFDDLTALASAICETPIATISLIDKDRQWFKSAVGLTATETPREVSFCAHAIAGSEIMQVRDATLDARFANNPFVTADPSIRFYAGAPLVTPERHAIGTLCVIDRVPRTLTPAQEQALEILSRQVVSMLEFRRALLNLTRLESEREESNQQLRLFGSALNQTSDAVMITTGQLNLPGPQIVFVNPAFTAMTGYSTSEVIGETPRILQGARTDRAQLDCLRRALSNGERFDGEAINYRKDGTEFSNEWSVSAVRNERGAITHFIATQRDITERKRIADELKQSRDVLEERVKERTRDLEETNARLREEIAERERTQEALSQTQEQFLQAQKMEALGQLAGGVAHDFNNVLTAIMGYGTLLLDALPQSERENSHVAEILRSAERAAGLSKQLLTFSRRQPYQATVVEVGGLIDGVKKLLRQVIGDRIVLRTHVDADLCSVKADAGQLEQILLNLAINARDAMPAGGTISITASNVTLPPDAVQIDTDASEFVALSVRDAGTGIPPEVMPRIFEPFFTTKRPGHGTGLGLATCSAIAEKSGGWIACRSQLGLGTEFTIYLPAGDERAEDVARPRHDLELPRGEETILVVEDEPAVGELLELLLSNLGYDVIRAEDGQEAQEAVAFREAAIDLVLTDLNMPRMDGRELVRRLSPRNPGLKVLLTSGDEVSEFDDTSGLEFEFLPKPFTMHTLAHRVREVLDS